MRYYCAHLQSSTQPESQYNTKLTVSGGRSSAKNWVKDAFVVDVSGLRRVVIDKDDRTIMVAGGCLVSDVVRALEEFNGQKSQ